MPGMRMQLRIEEAAERGARLVRAFSKLATRFHATHSPVGLFLTCEHQGCREAAAALRKWRGEDGRTEAR